MQPPIPGQMPAVLLRGHGGFEQLEYRDDIPVPVPAPGEVLLRVLAAAVNNTDINTRTGWYASAVTEATSGLSRQSPGDTEDGGWTGAAFVFPRIQGADACAQIVAVGAGIAAERIGERVLVDPVLRNSETAPYDVGYFGADRDGAFAQFACVPAANAVAIRSACSDVELASFPCSYLAAENMLARASVRAEDTLLITGASGGVGSAAVQLAKRRGATIIAIAGDSKAAQLRELGAAQVLDRDADLVAELGDESIDVVIDCVGGPQFPSALQLLRRGGRYAVAGAIGGPVVPLDLRTLYLKDLAMFGCTVPSAQCFSDLIGYIERAEIRPLISDVFPLRDIAMAQRSFLKKEHVGKIVLLT